MRRRPAVLTAVLTAALLATLGGAVGLALPAAAQERIVGGRAASITDVPWQVALVHPGGTDFTGQFCGGSLIDSNHVLTAAHCVTEEDDPTTPANEAGTVSAPGSLVVVAGTSFLAGSAAHPTAEATRQERAVSAVARMPSYDAAGESDDVAVLTLASSVTEGPTARPIALGADRVGGGTLLVSGWGSTQQKEDDTAVDLQQYPDALRANDVGVVSDADCSADYGAALDASAMLCAGSFDRDTCQGDSGGPAVQDGVLVGVTSFGVGCGSSHPYPGVYAELADPDIGAFVRAQADLGAAPTPTTTTTATTPAPTTTTTPAPAVLAPAPAPTVVAPRSPPTPLVLPAATISVRASGRVDRRGRIAVRVSANRDGAVSLRVRDASGRTLGRASTTLVAGTARTVRVRLTAAARRTLRSRSRARGVATTVVASSASTSVRRAVTLKR